MAKTPYMARDSLKIVLMLNVRILTSHTVDGCEIRFSHHRSETMLATITFFGSSSPQNCPGIRIGVLLIV